MSNSSNTTMQPPRSRTVREAQRLVRPTRPGRVRWRVWVAAAAAVLVVAAGTVVFLANQRGEDIARQRGALAEQQAVGKFVQAFRGSKGALVMKDGSRRELDGATSVLLVAKPIPGTAATWVALGRDASGVYFGQRFNRDASGAVRAVTDAQEVSSEVALGGLHAQIVASGADDQAARAFVEAANTGHPVAVGR